MRRLPRTTGADQEALAASWTADRDSLEREGYELSVIRERPTFVEAAIRRGDDSVVIQWAHDSAYRLFPLVEHEELGLAPAPAASRETLDRRLFLDLLGLPPVKATGENLPSNIDEILASPAYGVRWGRHWLDVARWAESNGYQHNRDRPQQPCWQTDDRLPIWYDIWAVRRTEIVNHIPGLS